jgi:hypothetical protein
MERKASGPNVTALYSHSAESSVEVENDRAVI